MGLREEYINEQRQNKIDDDRRAAEEAFKNEKALKRQKEKEELEKALPRIKNELTSHIAERFKNTYPCSEYKYVGFFLTKTVKRKYLLLQFDFRFVSKEYSENKDGVFNIRLPFSDGAEAEDAILQILSDYLCSNNIKGCTLGLPPKYSKGRHCGWRILKFNKPTVEEIKKIAKDRKKSQLYNLDLYLEL